MYSGRRGVLRSIGLVGLVAPGVLLLTVPLLALVFEFILPYSRSGLSMPDGIITALRLSLVTTSTSVLVIVLTGTPCAWVLARSRRRVATVISTLVELPVILPPVLAGLGLLVAFGPHGFIGRLLADAGIRLPFTTAAVVLAQVFVAFPFYTRTVQVRFMALPVDPVESARIDGAGNRRVFWSIILPASRSAIAAGITLSWARAFGEFGATIVFAGNSPGTTRTLPLQLYGALEKDFGLSAAVALWMLGISLVTLVIFRLLNHRATGAGDTV